MELESDTHVKWDENRNTPYLKKLTSFSCFSIKLKKTLSLILVSIVRNPEDTWRKKLTWYFMQLQSKVPKVNCSKSRGQVPHGYLATPMTRGVRWHTGTSAGFWLGGSMPPCRLKRKKFRTFDYEMAHSEIYLNKYVVSIAPFSTPACPDCSQNITQT